jgi:beta-lactam-binding protein with PASTA domain
MGKLLILLLVVVLLAVVLVWVAAMLQRRQEKSSLGLQGSRRRLRALTARTGRLEAALREIRDTAQTSGNVLTRDPAFDYIIDKVDQALDPKATTTEEDK